MQLFKHALLIIVQLKFTSTDHAETDYSSDQVEKLIGK